MSDANPFRPGPQADDGPNPAAFGWGVDADQAPMHEMLPPIATRYLWQDDFGDVGPEVPELEKALFSNAGNRPPGDDLDVLTSVPVTLECEEHFKPFTQWADAGLHPLLLENIAKSGYNVPMPIQGWTIPPIMAGQDVISTSQTGSGKTPAYLIPIISKLMGKAMKLCGGKPRPGSTEQVQAQPLVMIVAPTRELCLQIFTETCKLSYRSMLRPCVAYGGANRRTQLDDIKKGCDILIGTPGRLKDFILNEPKWVSLRRLKFTVMDEADELLDLDWDAEMGPLLLGGAAQHDGDHQFLFFSATFPGELRRLARGYLAEDYARIRVGRIGACHGNVFQTIVWADEDSKEEALADLMCAIPPMPTLIFCNTNRRVERLEYFLAHKKLSVASLFSGLSQHERETNITAFREGHAKILVCTSLAARGLDIPGVMHVINFELPSVMHGGITEYTHRIGRTGRMGRTGQATAFYNERDEGIAEDLVKIMMEQDFEIPDFLEHLKPSDGVITWDDNSDDETEVDHETGTQVYHDKEAATNSDEWCSGQTASAGVPTGWEFSMP